MLTPLGYVGRILLHANPFDDTGFEMQICCLIIAPVGILGITMIGPG